ncbi:MAG: hypothetical protein HN576_16810 [Bacteriovoracaceae bacterium]|nr:hypothetical protein [Bacteriovoracaceae bacterium]
MRVYKRSPVIRNIGLYILLSIIYLHIVESVAAGRSAVDFTLLQSSFEQHTSLTYLLCLSLLLVFRVSSLAPFIFLLFCGATFYYSIEVFFMTFNKVILSLNFIYIGLSFVSFIMLKTELEEAIYVPGFHKNGINKFSEYDLEGIVVDSSGAEIKGYLSNWGTQGCFFVPTEFQMIRGKIKLKFEFGTKEFLSDGRIMTKYGEGYGISIKQIKGQKERFALGWNEYYDIINQRGYVPRNQ